MPNPTSGRTHPVTADEEGDDVAAHILGSRGGIVVDGSDGEAVASRTATDVPGDDELKIHSKRTH